jgi:DNA polymerase epsilon subunit 1
VFQGEVFEQFLAGASLEECYGAVGAVANRWLDMLDTQVGGFRGLGVRG